ncbi:multiple sugar transport system permease protein [Kineococcus radiotolerans]|uniref:Multiple sugar transport system permease protein n=1 Tax=Kineococcus radiotolerans TaxID=131568 RepID=A0A7W4XXR5_KINRA|nr:sugar ABC transporter permease [Kineococcus radiotolerans]MBB2902356.1 multiple sugar transport system permease protein [Kineococcus radiotolerans]
MSTTSGVATGAFARGEPPLDPGRRRKSLHDGSGRRATLLIAPTIVLLAIVILYPVVTAVSQSFTKDAGLDPETGLFVEGGFAGLENYRLWLLQDCGGGAFSCPPGTLGSQFWTSTGVTFLFTVVAVSLETLLGLVFALVMHRSFKGRAILRASVLVPWAIPTAVTAKLWYFIFAYDGIANKLLGTEILWTGDGFAPKAAIIIADTWKTAPFMALLILAGLQVIDGSVYEASKMDGATAWQRFRYITLPLVRPALMVAVLFRTLDTLRMYDLPKILTGGAGDTSTLSMLVVDQVRSGFNAASALSTLTFLIVFAVAFVFIKFLGANVTEQRAPKTKKAG